MFIPRQERWNLPRMPNVYINAVSIKRVCEYFGSERVVLMSKASVPVVKSADLVTPEMQRFYPQDHPFWLEFREMFRLTGSVSFHLMLGSGPIAAKHFHLPKMMISTKRTVQEWTDQRMRLKHKRIPRTPMEPSGLCNCECGKSHEAAGIGCFMRRYENDPNIKYEEVGSIAITVDMVNRRGLYNVFDNNKPFTTLPTLADSADGRVTMTCIKTGKKVVRALEMKCRTEFMSWWTPIFAGADFMQMNDPEKDKWQMPFDKPKNYYMQQTTVFHLLALELDEALFCSHTTEKGMNIFLLKFNVRYASIVISFLNLLYERFICRDMDVPTDWAYNQPDRHILSIYNEFVNLTNALCDNTPVYDHVPSETTRLVAASLADPALQSTATSPFLHYPNVPKWPAPMTLLCYHARALFPWSRTLWIGDYEQLEKRRENLRLVAQICPTLHFTAGICDALQKEHEFGDDSRIELFVTQHELVQRAETFLVKVLQRFCDCRTDDHIPGDTDLETLDEAKLLAIAATTTETMKRALDIAPFDWLVYSDEEAAAAVGAQLEAMESNHPESLAWWAAASELTMMFCDAASLDETIAAHKRLCMTAAGRALQHPSLEKDELGRIIAVACALAFVMEKAAR